MSRPSWQQTIIKIAFAWSERATCPRMQAGCVAVDEGWHVLASGYNGAPSGMPHCVDVGCIMVEGHCLRSVHSEINMICHAARLGVSLVGAKIFITNRPCLRCTMAMIQCGVSAIYYAKPYTSEDSENIQQGMMWCGIGPHQLAEAVWAGAGTR